MGGKFAWLWLVRAAGARAVASKLKEAESAAAAAEAAVKRPVLVPWNEGGKKGKQKAPSGGGTVYVNRLPRRTSPSSRRRRSCASPARLPTSNTTARSCEASSPNAAASVLNVVNAGSGASAPLRFLPAPTPTATRAAATAATSAATRTRVCADCGGREAHLPTGWIHNRRVVDVELLLRACEEASPKPLSADFKSRVTKDGAARNEALKGLLAGDRKARDDARAMHREGWRPTDAQKGEADPKKGGRVAGESRRTARLAAGGAEGGRGERAGAPRRGGKGKQAAAAAAAEDGGDKVKWRGIALERLRARQPGWAWLRATSVTFRGLPAAVTATDLAAALGRYPLC